MEKDVKIIANYLPQFHEIPENNAWWGEGFTDWQAVKRAKPLYKGHEQPKEPLLDNYYSLDQIEAIRWQAELAKKYGVYGFGIYHYWFSSSLHLLGKPAELLLNDPSVDIRYLFIWDNCSWKRTWSNVRSANDWAPQADSARKEEHEGSGVLAELIYGGEEDWKAHFEYLLPFFRDERYIKKDNKPMFGFFQSQNNYEAVSAMCDYWEKLAKESGFNGMYFLSKYNYERKLLENSFLYEPTGYISFSEITKKRIRNVWNRKFPKHCHVKRSSYEGAWRRIFKKAKRYRKESVYYGAFVGYDDTPRRGKKGLVFEGATPERFEKNIKKLIRLSREAGKEYLFLTAWNEWGEGAYLEPDKKNGFRYLEALKNAIEAEK